MNNRQCLVLLLLLLPEWEVLSKEVKEISNKEDDYADLFGSEEEADVTCRAVDVDQEKYITLKNGVAAERFRWPNATIPYAFDGSHDSKDVTKILRGMDTFYMETCVRFVERTTETDYVEISRKKEGCFATIGRIGGTQVVNLGQGCVITSVVQHEFMHSLGFFHEHTRPDRDDYIDILWENIKKGQEHNFQKRKAAEVLIFNTSYDFLSTMHYTSNAFSVDNMKLTIVPKIRVTCPSLRH